MWGHFLGRGFFDPVDDLRPSNPATMAGRLDALAENFASHGFDVQRLAQKASFLFEVDEAEHTPDPIDALTVRVLARKPTAEERDKWLAHVRATPKRRAYEDLLWAMLNSSEFAFNHGRPWRTGSRDDRTTTYPHRGPRARPGAAARSPGAAIGRWVSKRLPPPESGLPIFVSLGGPSAGAGFFGVEHGPFLVRVPGKMPDDVERARGIDEPRFASRMSLLDAMEADFSARTGADPKVEGRRAIYAKADRLMHAAALEAFDVSKESASVRAAFGATPFGDGCA